MGPRVLPVMAFTPSTRLTGAPSRANLGENAMNIRTSHTFGYSLAMIAAAGFVIGCADNAPVGPKSTKRSTYDVQAASDGRFPDLAGCTQLAVPAGSNISFHVFGVGFQVYRWDGTQWKFSNPEAKLFADASQNALVGTHFSEPGAKPNWLTTSGSRVIGTKDAGCPVNNAIDWVRLKADNSGTGVFNQTTFIQRLNTVGGLAPTTPGINVGDEFKSPYTADYYFYHE